MLCDQFRDVLCGAEHVDSIDPHPLFARVVVHHAEDGEGLREVSFLHQPDRKLSEFPRANDEDALSNGPLHAAVSDRRAALMPIESKYPMADVLTELRAFPRRVTFEYVMIRGRNDADTDAVSLANHARALGAHVNLLPLHPGGAPNLTPAGPARIRAFAGLLRDHGVNVTVRKSRGLDIDAACGQLRIAAEVGGVGT
jgi:hypothetical protein